MKMMILDGNKKCGGATTNDDMSVYSTTGNGATLFIIYGQKAENFHTYTYEFDTLKLEKEIAKPYILDLYLIDSSYSVGYGKVLSTSHEVIYEF